MSTPGAPALPQPGWYPDPSGQAPLRWWRGDAWSELVTGLGRALPLAGWWARARAYLLDAGPLWLASMLLFERWHGPFLNELVGILRVSALTQGGRWPTLAEWWSFGLFEMWLVTALPGVLLRVGYDMACLLWRGATIGQQRLGLRVVPTVGPDDPSRPRLAWHRALRRSLVLRGLAPTCLGWLACVLWPLVDPQRRSLADLAAGTRVVALPQGPGTDLPAGA